MSPWPKSCSPPCSPMMVRLSILEVTWKLIRVGKLALMVPVITSTEGRCVAMIRWMPAARALDILSGHHHQVGDLVDHHHQIGHGLRAEFFFLIDRPALVIEAGLHGADKVLALGLGLHRA